MRLKLLMVLIMTLFLTGCWDEEDVTNRVIVLGLGLDKAPNGNTKVSIQVPIVEELLSPGGGEEVAAKPFTLITSEGKSAFAAVPGLQSKTQRSIFYGQIKAVIIGKDLAESGLAGSTEFLRRHPEAPPQAFLLITKREASEILGFTLANKRLPAYAPVTFFHAHRKGDQAFPQRVWEFDRNIHSQTQDAYIPMIDYSHKEQAFLIRGLGVFHDDKLAGSLSGEETRMFGFLSGLANNGYVSLPIEKYGRITFRRVRSKPKVRIRRIGKEIDCEIKINASGYLVESTAGAVQLTEQDLEIMQKKTAAYLKRESAKTIKHLQQLNSDILALGEKFRATYPDEWEKIDWDKTYPEVKIRLSVKFEIPRSGTTR